MSKRDGERRRALTREERALWKTFTKAIAPIRAPAIEEDDTDDAPAPPPAAKARARATKPAPAPEPTRLVTPPLAKLDRRTRQRVARGRDTIEGRLDLHGFYQDEAHAALLHFLRRASADGKKLVLVITGKGRGGEQGVLRRQVPQWLNLPEFRGYVIGFEVAHVAHGGEGALYVRVRRPR